MKKVFVSVLIALLFGAVVLTEGFSQAPQEDRQFVYGMNVYLVPEHDYSGELIPRNLENIYLLSNVENIISPRYTLVYYWPITNEYQADWTALNETIPGRLEILQGGKILRTLEQTNYVIQYPNGQGSGVRLYIGQEAVTKYNEFLKAENDYRNSLSDYYNKLLEYDNLSPAAQGSQAPPVQPAPLEYSSTGLNDGFPVNLANGVYTIRLRGDNGQVVPYSEKKLILFGSLRESIGFSLVPADKWVSPEKSDNPDQIIYARGKSTMYLQPFNITEYNDFYYNHLRTPQGIQGNSDQTIWVYMQPLGAEMLRVIKEKQPTAFIRKKPYWVEQTAGSALGYIIQDNQDPNTPPRSPDLEGFRIDVEAGASSYTAQIMNESGPQPSAERNIHVVNTENSRILYIFPIIPILLITLITVVQRRETD